MSKQFEEIEFNGNRYRRYPNSHKKSRKNYFTKVNGSGYGMLHRHIYEHFNGEIEKGNHIHHKDGNPLNNDISNLESVTPKQHGSLHADEFREQRQKHIENIRPLASKWHGSDKGIEFHKKLGKLSWKNRTREHDGICEMCGTNFKSFKKEPRFCSRKCNQKDSDQRVKIETTTSICKVCNKEFTKFRSSRVKTCGKECKKHFKKQSDNSSI